MNYGTLAVDYIVYSSGGTNVTATVSSVFNGDFPNMGTTGTISGNHIIAESGDITGTLSGDHIAGTSGTFVNVFASQTVTGATGIFTNATGVTASFTTVTGTTGSFTTVNAGSIPGFAVLSGAQSFSGGQRCEVNIISFSTGIALDFDASNNFEITLTGNTTLQNPTNVTSGQAGVVTIIQGTGNNTMAFGSNWSYPGGSGSVPSLTTTSGAKDLLVYYSINSNEIAYRLVQDIKA